MIGVSLDKKIAGQIARDSTLQDIARSLRLETIRASYPSPDSANRLASLGTLGLLPSADTPYESSPPTLHGRPYERIGYTTLVSLYLGTMPRFDPFDPGAWRAMLRTSDTTRRKIHSRDVKKVVSGALILLGNPFGLSRRKR